MVSTCCSAVECISVPSAAKGKSAMKVTKRKNRASDEDTSDGEQVEKQRKKARIANSAGVEMPISVNAADSEGKSNGTLLYGRSIHLQP